MMKVRRKFTVVALLSAIAVCTVAHSQELSTTRQPEASKRTYTAAAVQALPGLQCKVYPSGGDRSSSLTVFTNDDGYARFHAIRASSHDAVQQLTLDCTDAAGTAHSYSADLTSEETFAPRPVDLSKERGRDRPALERDPQSYSQSELIQAGYGLRPDATQAPAAYARWLRAASIKGRILEAKRPNELSHGITSTTSPWWVGTVLTGKPTYISTEAMFNVPTAIADGNASGTTGISIWNGLGGFGTGSGLIQGGIDVTATPTAASYRTFREYCCEDHQGDGYGGDFVPSPGDEIYSQEWYCDASGNANINGGFGCTFLEDLSSGAILSCTAANGSPCWSVKQLPLCSTSPTVPNCMTLGPAAEFIVENVSGQIFAGSNAFTDFTPRIAMQGAAFSSQTNTWQTISTDPSVFLLKDFTNTMTHIAVGVSGSEETDFSIVPAGNWVDGLAQTIPIDALRAGTDVDGTPLYVCRGGQNEGFNIQVGKFRGDFPGCDIAINGVEKTVGDFQVLAAAWQFASGGVIPSNATYDGSDDIAPPNTLAGPPLYHCRANVNGSLQLGKIGAGFGACFVPYGGQELHVPTYEVLVDLSPKVPFTKSVAGSSGTIPVGAVQAGTDSDGAPLYVCSGWLNGSLQPGKTRAGWNACDVSFAGGEQFLSSYAFLVTDWRAFSGVASTPGYAAGRDVDGTPLLVCRAFGVWPGKFRPDVGSCHVGFGGTDFAGTSFDVLSPFVPQVQ